MDFHAALGRAFAGHSRGCAKAYMHKDERTDDNEPRSSAGCHLGRGQLTRAGRGAAY